MNREPASHGPLPPDAEWSNDVGGWQPTPRRPTPLWQSARLAGLLGVALVSLVVVAVLLPGLTPPGPGRPAAGSPSAGLGGGAPTLTPEPSFVRPTPTPLPTFASYVVQAGDSLNSIADRFETTARSIAFWNRAAYPTLDPDSERYEPDRIEIGWTLVLLPGVVYGQDGTPTPTPAAPTSLPSTPIPSGPSPSPPTTGGPSSVVSHGPRGTNRIALTFDMGGRLEPAVEMMQWLAANDVRGTIFPTGRQGTQHELGRPAMEIVRDHPELFELGNHSWDHPAFTDLSAAEIRDQLERSEAALFELVGRSTKPWFRPPYGAWDATVRDVVGRTGWGHIVMWDIDTIDWRPTSEGGPTAKDIEAKVLANAQGGSIVLMHLGGWHTLEALPGILDGLREKGLEPVTLSELLGG